MGRLSVRISDFLDVNNSPNILWDSSLVVSYPEEDGEELPIESLAYFPIKCVFFNLTVVPRMFGEVVCYCLFIFIVS